VDEGDEAAPSGHASGVDEDDDEEEAAEDENGDVLVAKAAQDFTSMRLSVAATGRNVSGSVVSPSGGSSAASASSSAPLLPPGTPASREELRVSACILSADATRDKSGGSEFILYMISVTTGNTAGLSWKVGRRFREFEALHTALCARFGKDRFKLPKKALRRSLEPEYVRKKKTELAKYLTDLMLDPDVSASQELAHFLVSSLQDVVRGSVENLRVFAARGNQLRELEAQLQRVTLERSRVERERDQIAKDLDQARKEQEQVAQKAEEELKRQRDAWAEEKAALLAAHAAALSEAQKAAEATAAAQLASSNTDWETRYNELASHTKAALKDKKAALRAVQDLDALVKKLKAEKKILVKEVKENRARLAELGALEDGGGAQVNEPATPAAGAEDGGAEHAAAVSAADANAAAASAIMESPSFVAASPSPDPLAGLALGGSNMAAMSLLTSAPGPDGDELAAALLESPINASAATAGDSGAAEVQHLSQLSTPAPVE
jgi:hypothetical protein